MKKIPVDIDIDISDNHKDTVYAALEAMCNNMIACSKKGLTVFRIDDPDSPTGASHLLLYLKIGSMSRNFFK